MQHIHVRVLFVGVHVSGQLVTIRTFVRGFDPQTGGIGRLTHHILSCGIAGGVIESQVAGPRDRPLLDVGELANPRGGFRGRLDFRKMILHPGAEFTSLSRIGKNKRRSALHELFDHGGFDTAALADRTHAATVAGNKSALGRCHGNQKIAACVLAVYSQRSGNPERNLSDADEILDIARQELWIDAVTRDMVQFGTAVAFDKLAPLRRPVCAVVIVFAARNALTFCHTLFSRRWPTSTRGPMAASQWGCVVNNASSPCEKPLPAAFAMLGSVTANAGKGQCKLLLWVHCGQRRSLSCLDDCIGFRTFFGPMASNWRGTRERYLSTDCAMPAVLIGCRCLR